MTGTQQGPDQAQETLLKPPETALELNVSEKTLSNWRRTGTGPKYIRFSHKCVRYAPSDIEAFKAAHTFASTSAESVGAKGDDAA